MYVIKFYKRWKICEAQLTFHTFCIYFNDFLIIFRLKAIIYPLLNALIMNKACTPFTFTNGY